MKRDRRTIACREFEHTRLPCTSWFCSWFALPGSTQAQQGNLAPHPVKVVVTSLALIMSDCTPHRQNLLSQCNMNKVGSPRTTILPSDYRAIAEYYDYGYDTEMDESSDDSMWMLCMNEAAAGASPELQESSDRINRKKSRSFCRRNGVGHSGLLKSAVLATIDSQDDADATGCIVGRHESIGFCSVSSADDRPTSPRKRARRFSPAFVEEGDDDLILQACDLFGTVMGFSIDEAPEELSTTARRVSRRRSNESPKAESRDHDL